MLTQEVACHAACENRDTIMTVQP